MRGRWGVMVGRYGPLPPDAAVDATAAASGADSHGVGHSDSATGLRVLLVQRPRPARLDGLGAALAVRAAHGCGARGVVARRATQAPGRAPPGARVVSGLRL